ncbi:MAG: DnaJ domain-containing protein [Crocinitomicaceae bacterium]
MKSRRTYFKILGIEPTNDQQKIKRAYRKKAMSFHPDRNQSPDAEARFIEINEAYEVLTGQQTLPSESPVVKTAEEVRQEKVRRARERFQDIKSREKQKEAEYFESITSGRKWQIFKMGALYCFILNLMLLTDYVADRTSTMVMNPEALNVIQRKIIVDNETFFVDDDTYWRYEFVPIKVNKSFFFKDTKSITLLTQPPKKYNPEKPTTIKREFYLYDKFQQATFYAYGSVYYFFPLPHLFLFVPLILTFFKRPNFRFSLWRIVSIWAIIPYALILIIWEGRILYLFGIL